MFGAIEARGRSPVSLPGLYQDTDFYKRWSVNDYDLSKTTNLYIRFGDDSLRHTPWSFDIAVNVSAREMVCETEKPVARR